LKKKEGGRSALPRRGGEKGGVRTVCFREVGKKKKEENPTAAGGGKGRKGDKYFSLRSTKREGGHPQKGGRGPPDHSAAGRHMGRGEREKRKKMHLPERTGRGGEGKGRREGKTFFHTRAAIGGEATTRLQA